MARHCQVTGLPDRDCDCGACGGEPEGSGHDETLNREACGERS